MCPTHCIVGVRFWPTKLVDPLHHELRRLQGCRTVEVDHFVKSPVECAFCRCAVVADDVIDESVIQNIELLEAVEQSSNVMVCVLHKSCVIFHLPSKNGLERFGHVVKSRDLFVPLGKLGVGRDHTLFLLARKSFFAQLVPTSIKLALVLIGPFLWYVVRSVCSTRCKVDEERLVRDERLLLAYPTNGFVRHILNQVVAFFRRPSDFDGCGALV